MKKMDIVGVDDAHILDPDLLHLYSPSSHIADELFSHWLSLSETATLVKSLIDEAKSGTPTNLSKSYATINVLGATVFLSNGIPPLSPQSSPGSPRFSRQRTSPPSLRSPLRSVKEPKHRFLSSNSCVGIHQQKN